MFLCVWKVTYIVRKTCRGCQPVGRSTCGCVTAAFSRSLQQPHQENKYIVQYVERCWQPHSVIVLTNKAIHVIPPYDVRLRLDFLKGIAEKRESILFCYFSLKFVFVLWYRTLTLRKWVLKCTAQHLQGFCSDRTHLKMAIRRLSSSMFVMSRYTPSNTGVIQLKQYAMVSGLALASARLVVQFLSTVSLPGTGVPSLQNLQNSGPVYSHWKFSFLCVCVFGHSFVFVYAESKGILTQ